MLSRRSWCAWDLSAAAASARRSSIPAACASLWSRCCWACICTACWPPHKSAAMQLSPSPSEPPCMRAQAGGGGGSGTAAMCCCGQLALARPCATADCEGGGGGSGTGAGTSCGCLWLAGSAPACGPPGSPGAAMLAVTCATGVAFCTWARAACGGVASWPLCRSDEMGPPRRRLWKFLRRR